MNHEVRTQWHPAFCSAMELNFREDRAQLHFETEHNLSRKPLAVDLLIVRKDGTGELQDPVGRLFARNNLIEYKSPDDAMTIDTLYKVIGYGCLFKSMSPAVNSIPSDEITLTLIRNRYPRRMIEELVKEQISCIQKCPGIYYLTGKIPFRTQLVITRQLKGKKEDPMMCDALKELMKPEIEESLEKGRQEGLAEGGVNALLQIGWAPSRIAEQLHLNEDRVNEIIKKIQSER